MECVKWTDVISAVLDGAGTAWERRQLAEHANNCPVCSSALVEHRRVQQTLSQLPKLVPPHQLQTQLRVAASRERERTITRLNFTSQYAAWRDRMHLNIKNLMQPFALPVAGGLISALLLFGLLLPEVRFGVRTFDNDVPTGLFTEASVKDSFPPAMVSEVVVDLTVDDQGRLIAYEIVKGGSLLDDESLRRRFESALLFTQFNPATAFGQRIAGKIRVSFRSSTIEVRG